MGYGNQRQDCGGYSAHYADALLVVSLDEFAVGNLISLELKGIQKLLEVILTYCVACASALNECKAAAESFKFGAVIESGKTAPAAKASASAALTATAALTASALEASASATHSSAAPKAATATATRLCYSSD